MLEQWLSGLELKIEIYGYIVQVRGSRGLYTWDLYKLPMRSCATSDTLVKKKKEINTTMCLKNNKRCSSHSCRLSSGCQGVPQPGLDVWSEQRGAAVPWVRWGAAGGAQAPLWLSKGWVGWGAAGARAGNFTPGTGSCLAAAADAGGEGRELPIPCDWGEDGACSCLSQEGAGSPGAGGSGSTAQEGRKMHGKCQSERCTGSRVGGKALSGQPRLALQGWL